MSHDFLALVFTRGAEEQKCVLPTLAASLEPGLRPWWSTLLSSPSFFRLAYFQLRFLQRHLWTCVQGAHQVPVQFLPGSGWCSQTHCYPWVFTVSSLTPVNWLTPVGWWGIHCRGLSCVSHFCHVQLFATPWTVAHQAPLSMGSPKQEDLSGLPFPSPRDLPNPGIQPHFTTSQAASSSVWATREA